MSLLSELIMRYDINLEDALREIIQKGIPVNLFLKTGGIEDLVKDFINKLKNQINAIKENYDIRSGIHQTEMDLKNHSENFEKKLNKNKDFYKKFKDGIKKKSFDLLNQLKWEIFKHSFLSQKISHREMNQILKDIEDLNFLLEGLKKYNFRGNINLNREESIQLLKNLQELEKLIENLQNALESGDIFRLDDKTLKKFLGEESYNEFIERREMILGQLKNLLEKQGKIIQNEKGEIQLSPESIRRIGKKSLEEIFKHLKADDGGSLYAKEDGESEQVTPNTKPYEYGDSISNIDFPNSILNAFIRKGIPKPDLSDLEVFKSRGMSRSSIVILLDMSGSMYRVDRFYYAKKMILALESFIRQFYKEDSLYIVGFGTVSRIFSISQIPSLQPYPVTLFDPYIRLRIDMLKRKSDDYQRIPEYFTNLQSGLALSRKLLSNRQTRNKQIILVTDGVPTAHFEKHILHINYPPSPADFDFALKEAIQCKEQEITINTFLLTSEWNHSYFENRSFIYDFAKITQGRIFYPHPNDLTKFVLADFIEEKKKLIS